MKKTHFTSEFSAKAYLYISTETGKRARTLHFQKALALHVLYQCGYTTPTAGSAQVDTDYIFLHNVKKRFEVRVFI